MDTSLIESRMDLVSRLLSGLRCHALGGDVPCVLPLIESTRAEQAAHIRSLSARLTFLYAAANPAAAPDELRACKLRLLASLTYLQYECNRSDQTFGSLLRLAALENNWFCSIIGSAAHTPHRQQHLYRIPADGSLPTLSMERAVLLFLSEEGHLPEEDALRGILEKRHTKNPA